MKFDRMPDVTIGGVMLLPPSTRDVLIRNVPLDTLDRIDEIANAAGVSRNEYVRRLLSAVVAR